MDALLALMVVMAKWEHLVVVFATTAASFSVVYLRRSLAARDDATKRQKLRPATALRCCGAVVLLFGLAFLVNRAAGQVHVCSR